MTSLSDSIRFLRNAAPDEFEQFRQAFGRYSDEVRQTCIDAPEKVELMQGQARMCGNIFKWLSGEHCGR